MTSVPMSRTLSAVSLNHCNKWTINWSCRARMLITYCQQNSSKICLRVAVKIVRDMTYNVFGGTLNLAQSTYR